MIRAFRYDVTDLRPWEADLILADHFDEIVITQNIFHEEMAAARADTTLMSPDQRAALKATP